MDSMDKKALLNELKIDRDDDGGDRKPVKWLVAAAVVGGIGFVAWAFGRPYLNVGGAAADAAEVPTVVVRAVAPTEPGTSVLDATGYVVARRQATVSAKTTGKVMEVLIEEGMTVEEGQLLAVLDASIQKARLALFESQLASAGAQLEEIRVSIRQAALDYSRTKDLAERELASQAELDRARLTLQGLQARLKRSERDIEVADRSLAVQRRELDDMEIRAPFGGVVIAKAAQPGEMISPISAGGGFTRTGICTIVDMDSLEVEVDVNEAYINRVYPQQPVTVTLNAYADFAIPAYVIATIPAADRNKATVRVRIGFKERDARILPDMGVRVAFLEDVPGRRSLPEPKILVPRAAVGEVDGSRFVWVVSVVSGAADGRGVLARRDVTVGRSQGARIEVADGLEDGERIAASADPGFADGDEINLN